MDVDIMHESHSWSPGQPPPRIRAHSLTKHKVLDQYLRRYVRTLTSNVRRPQFSLTVIDGFAGGNIYRNWKTGEEEPGSPSIILNALAEAGEEAKAKRKKEFQYDPYCLFIDNNDGAYESLCATIRNSPHGAKIGQSIQILKADFNEQCPGIVDFLCERRGGGRVLFVLDQCGYKDVPFDTIRMILSRLGKAEILLTFATDFLIDYLRNDGSRLVTINKLGIVLPARGNTTERARAESRRAVQLALHREIQEKTGARFYTPFFIRSKDSHRDFWLIHLSGHYKARDVMVGLHWDLNNCFSHYGGSGLKMLGYDPDEDRSFDSQGWLPGFYFDETARRSTCDALYAQMPRLLAEKFASGTDVESLFSRISNETPATVEILSEVLGELSCDGHLQVRDRTGLVRRRSGIQKKDDIIILDKQKRLFVWDGGDISRLK